MTNNVKSVPFSVKTLSFQCVVDDDDDESYNKEPVEMHKMKRRNLTVLSSETNDSHGNVRISSPITTIPHMPKKPLSVEPTIEQRRFDGTSVCFYGRRTTRTIRDRSTRTKRRNGPGVTCRRPDGANAAGRTWRPRGVNGHNRTGRTYTRRGANGSRAGRSCTADGESADGRTCSRRAGASGLRIRYERNGVGTPDCPLREMAKQWFF